MNGKVFIVRKNNPDRFIKILSLIDTYISYLKKLLSENMSNFIHHPCYSEIVNFVKTKHTVQEISEQDTFEGINKPEDIRLLSGMSAYVKIDTKNWYRINFPMKSKLQPWKWPMEDRATRFLSLQP